MLRFVIAVLIGAALAVAVSPSLRDDLKELGPVRQAQLWLYNFQYPPLTPEDLGDGGPAAEIILSDPAGLAAGPDGTVFVADRGRPGRGRIVWRIDGGGLARVVIGTGRRGRGLADRPARTTNLGSPEGMAVDGSGRLYVPDSYNHTVLRLGTDGHLIRIAGVGRPGDVGDGGPATAAALSAPYDVAVDSLGNLYIADYGNHRIRRVSADGTIETVAGTGDPGYSGDGGPATAAQLNGPYGVYVDSQDRLWIADSQNHVVRRVDADGAIRTIAGRGSLGYEGDGGPAAEAVFDTPQSVAMDTQGRLIIGDEHNNAIRIVDHDGIITTLIGAGPPAGSTDVGPRVAVPLKDPEAMLVREDGSLLIAEGDGRRIIRLMPDGTIEPFAGRGQRSDPQE